ncbi:hypothetical protein CBR_g83733, partial [Chara braunii]
AEMEFLAEDELISIVPNFRSDGMHMLCGDFGPFRPQIPVKVPLWLALSLKKRRKCTLQTPDWMNVDNLARVLEEERESTGVFQELPFHYIEISQLLFDNAIEDLCDHYKMRTLIEDIRNVRFNKIQNGLQQLEGKKNAVKLNNVSAMEINIIRPFFIKALERFYKYDVDYAKAAATDNSQASNAPTSSTSVRGRTIQNRGLRPR